MTIYEVLFPPDSLYQGMIHFAVLTKDKRLVSLGYSDFQHLEEKIKKIKIRKSVDYYLTANTTMKFTKRKADNLFSLNNIVLDFDIHKEMEQIERDELINEFVSRINRDLFSIKPPFKIPKPNVIHYTGRGVQMWWHIEETSSKLLFLYHRAIDYLVRIFRDFLSEYPELEEYIDIDTGASKNAVGLFRMFKSYNTHTGARTKIKRLHDKGIELNTLVELLSKTYYIQEYMEEKEKRQIARQQQNQNNGSCNFTDDNYIALHKKRVAIIQQLAKERKDNVGERDIMLFLAFNSARQYMSFENAKKICQEINKSFSESLKSIEYIFKNQKIYKISNMKFYEQLNISEDEYKRGIPNLSRDLQREKNREEKEIKKAKAVLLLKQGLTLAKISDETGLSISTISRISSSLPKPIKKKSWEELGMSKSTYYRKKKKGII